MTAFTRAYKAWVRGRPTQAQAEMIEAWHDCMDENDAVEDAMAEITADVTCAPAKRYDEFMQRFGVPSTPEEAEVIGKVPWSCEEGDTAS